MGPPVSYTQHSRNQQQQDKNNEILQKTQITLCTVFLKGSSTWITLQVYLYLCSELMILFLTLSPAYKGLVWDHFDT